MKRRIRMAFMVVLSFTVLLIPSLAPATSTQWLYIQATLDKVEAFMMTPGVDFAPPGVDFETPGFINPAAGWSGSLVNPDYVLATGPDTLNFFLTYHFTSDPSTPFTIDLLGWRDDELLGRSSLDYNGVYWESPGTELPLEPGNYDRSPVPIPGAVWLLGSGLIGLVGIGRKRLKK